MENRIWGMYRTIKDAEKAREYIKNKYGVFVGEIYSIKNYKSDAGVIHKIAYFFESH